MDKIEGQMMWAQMDTANQTVRAEWVAQFCELFVRLHQDAIDCFIVFACVRRLFDVAVSLLQGAEKMGMRAEAVVAMRKNMAAHESVYWLLVERTGLRIKEVDEMLLSRLPLGQ